MPSLARSSAVGKRFNDSLARLFRESLAGKVFKFVPMFLERVPKKANLPKVTPTERACREVQIKTSTRAKRKTAIFGQRNSARGFRA